MNLELQRQLMGDAYRNRQLDRAIARLVDTGDVVLDLGAGTGFLGFLALKYGASRVIFVDQSQILEFAVTMAKKLGVERRCEFYQLHSSELLSELSLSQPVDLILCEILGSYLFEEHMLETLADAKRFLKPQGKILPSAVKMWVVPVISSQTHRKIDIWSRIGYGLSYEDTGPKSIRQVALSRMYVESVSKASCLKSSRLLCDMNMYDAPSSVWDNSVQWPLNQAERIFGFCLYWDATLLGGVDITTSPWKPMTHWKQVYLPLFKPLKARKGCVLELRVSSDTREQTGVCVSWAGKLLDRSQQLLTSFEMDTDRGQVGVY